MGTNYKLEDEYYLDDEYDATKDSQKIFTRRIKLHIWTQTMHVIVMLAFVGATDAQRTITFDRICYHVMKGRIHFFTRRFESTDATYSWRTE